VILAGEPIAVRLVRVHFDDLRTIIAVTADGTVKVAAK
jgi:hypothetical protein